MSLGRPILTSSHRVARSGAAGANACRPSRSRSQPAGRPGRGCPRPRTARTPLLAGGFSRSAAFATRRRPNASCPGLIESSLLRLRARQMEITIRPSEVAARFPLDADSLPKPVPELFDVKFGRRREVVGRRVHRAPVLSADADRLLDVGPGDRQIRNEEEGGHSEHHRSLTVAEA